MSIFETESPRFEGLKRHIKAKAEEARRLLSVSRKASLDPRRQNSTASSCELTAAFTNLGLS